MTQDGSYMLKSVAYHISTRCEAKCSFCYAETEISNKTPHAKLDEIERTLKKLSNDGVKNVLLVGGDPVVHPSLVKIIKSAKSNGLGVSVLSNTWTLKPESKFLEVIDLIDNFEFTILGSNKETHNSLTRTPNSFEKLLNNVKKISDQGKILGVCYSVMPQNINQIYDTIRVLKSNSINIASLMLQRVIPTGGCVGTNEFGLKLEHIENIMQQVVAIDEEYKIPITFEDPMPWCTVNEKYHKYLSRCEWGYSLGSINHEGSLNRCGADDKYRLGSIWDGNIQEKWNTNSILQSFRSKKYLPAECQICSLLEKCGGGCPLSMGTIKDHGIDFLYLSKNQKPKTKNIYIRNIFIDESYKISEIDHDIFYSTDDSLLFDKKDIDSLINRCPRSVIGLFSNNELIGFAVVVPLSKKGTKTVEQQIIPTIVSFNRDMICKDFDKNTDSIFIEVIGVKNGASNHARFMLVRYVTNMIKAQEKRIFMSPVTEKGDEIIKKFGFKRLGINKKLRAPVFYSDLFNRIKA